MSEKNKNDEVLMDKIKATAASTATTIGKQAGGLAVNAAIKSGALAMAASKISVQTVTKVAGHAATSEMRGEMKVKDKEIKELKKIIEQHESTIKKLELEIEQLKGN